MRRSSLRLVPALCALAGCFVYRPAETRNTPAGKQIEVTLNQQGAQAMAPQVGPAAYLVAGVLMGDDSAAIEMRFARVHRTDGKSFKGEGVMLRVPHEYVVSVY